MRAIFVELPSFERQRPDYLDDEGLRRLQAALLSNPQSGDLIEGTGGLRKVRFADTRRGKGKRGGLRVIYFYWIEGPEFWLFAVYDKDERSDLTPAERTAFKAMVKREQSLRKATWQRSAVSSMT